MGISEAYKIPVRKSITISVITVHDFPHRISKSKCKKENNPIKTGIIIIYTFTAHMQQQIICAFIVVSHH